MMGMVMMEMLPDDDRLMVLYCLDSEKRILQERAAFSFSTPRTPYIFGTLLT
jgi:hypothetical protein